MDIKEVQEKKRLVEEQIRDLIINFSEETGLNVVDINSNMTVIGTVGINRAKRVCVGITLDVEV